MMDQKLDNLLNLSQDASEREREKSWNLNVGYDTGRRLWEVIVKYSGSEEGLMGEGITALPLLGGFAVAALPEALLDAYSDRPQIEFVEKSRRLYFSLDQGTAASCITSVQIGREGLSGKGILLGIVDSGVDYRHPDFRNEDGSTRILRLWDQSASGRPPRGYAMGREYTKEEIDKALSLPEEEGYFLVPERDISGHGTSVLGIAAGNGRASHGKNRGVACESDLLVVKMGPSGENSFPRTTELIQGIDYLVRQSLEMGLPLVINLSIGNNYGSHRGDSLLETYIDSVAKMGRIVICAGTGNNGNDPVHTGGRMTDGETKEIELGVSPYEPVLNLQLWKSYADAMEVFLESPSGERIGPLYERPGTHRFRLEETELLIYYGEPGPFQITQEIYFDFIPSNEYVNSGVWKIILKGKRVQEGEYDLWLPGGGILNPNTGFFLPQAQGTLTIPSTASRVISVAAYDPWNDSYADFSGRGSGDLTVRKPDLAAPGVDITAPVPGGGYGLRTGTSFAAPFAAGAAALLMEWGITRGRDPFLYGEKVKAYLQRGARHLPGFLRYPNEEIGYGALCVKESLPERERI